MIHRCSQRTSTEHCPLQVTLGHEHTLSGRTALPWPSPEVWTEELEDSTSPKSAPGATYEVLIGHTGQRQGLRHDRKASRRARPAEAAKAAGDRAGAVDSWVSVLCKKLKAQDGRMKVKEKRRKRPKREGGGAGCGLTCS